MSKITLENMEFHAYHGCLEHERELGNTFIVSVTMELDTTHAGKTDELDHTLNYQIVYDVVEGQMNIPSKLIEHVGQRILDSIFNRVDLPAPLRPIIPMLSPGYTLKETSFNAQNSSSACCFLKIAVIESRKLK